LKFGGNEELLSFLLDEHISPVVATQIRAKESRIGVFPLLTWQEGAYLGLPDEVILQAAMVEQLTLVTYDQNTIPPILWDWGEREQTHGGVIFVDYQSIPPHNFGGFIQALIKLWREEGDRDWTNRLIYLKPKVQ
jgi:hypothetical protein